MSRYIFNSCGGDGCLIYDGICCGCGALNSLDEVEDEDE